MQSTPWKPLFAISLVLTAAGTAMLIWSIFRSIPWQGTMIGVFVIVIGSLLARMNYRAYRYAVIPTPSTTLPIVGISAAALLWIAGVIGMH